MPALTGERKRAGPYRGSEASRGPYRRAKRAGLPDIPEASEPIDHLLIQRLAGAFHRPRRGASVARDLTDGIARGELRGEQPGERPAGQLVADWDAQQVQHRRHDVGRASRDLGARRRRGSADAQPSIPRPSCALVRPRARPSRWLTPRSSSPAADRETRSIRGVRRDASGSPKWRARPPKRRAGRPGRRTARVARCRAPGDRRPGGPAPSWTPPARAPSAWHRARRLAAPRVAILPQSFSTTAPEPLRPARRPPGGSPAIAARAVCTPTPARSRRREGRRARAAGWHGRSG